MEENEFESQPQLNSSVRSITKPKICVQRLSMSHIDLKSSQNQHTVTHKTQIKVPSHVLTRRSPEFQKNLRAKTVRIGKIRWPPPLNPEDVDSANQQRFDFLIPHRFQIRHFF